MNKEREEETQEPCEATAMSDDHYQDSRMFLKCLLLQPVQDSNSKEECNAESIDNHNSPNCVTTEDFTLKMKNNAHDLKSVNILNEVGLNCVKDLSQEDPLNSNYMQVNLSDENFLNCEHELDKNRKRLSPLAEDSLHKSIGKEAHGRSFVFCEENYLKKDKYIFRDGNTKPELHFNETEDDILPQASCKVSEENVHHKKRLDKLIKSLKDREEKLKNKLKDAQVTEDSPCRDELNEATQKLKENLKVREKKKYESLINFEQGKWQAHNKAFQELLPGKMKQVDANVEKYFENLKPQRRKCRQSKTARQEISLKAPYKKHKQSSKPKNSEIHTNLQNCDKEKSVKSKEDTESKFRGPQTGCKENENLDNFEGEAMQNKSCEVVFGKAKATKSNQKQKESKIKKENKKRKCLVTRQPANLPAPKVSSKKLESKKSVKLNAKEEGEFEKSKLQRSQKRHSKIAKENKPLNICLESKNEPAPKATRCAAKAKRNKPSRNKGQIKRKKEKGCKLTKSQCNADHNLKQDGEEKESTQSTQSFESPEKKKNRGRQTKVQDTTKKKIGYRKSCRKKSSASQESKSNPTSEDVNKFLKVTGVSKKASTKKTGKSTRKKTPSAMFTLPPVACLEKDYELVGLSPTSSPRRGDFKTDHFFIPQCTFNKKGKTGMIMVGPFQLTSEPNVNLLLVPPGAPHSKKPMILQRKAHSPSNTPPRDFRIKKDIKQSGAPCLPALTHDLENIQVTFLDHSYMTPPHQWDRVKRFNKAVAKHSANAEFIDARVENIEETPNNVLVTIKGDNMLRMVDRLSDPTQAPIKTSKDGIPVIYTLSQIMTPVLHKLAARKKRDRLAQMSTRTGECSTVLLPLSSMGDAVVELVIPPGGTEITEISPPKPHKQHQIEVPKAFEGNTEESLEVTPKFHPPHANDGEMCDGVNFLNNNKTLIVLDDIDSVDVDKQHEDTAAVCPPHTNGGEMSGSVNFLNSNKTVIVLDNTDSVEKQNKETDQYYMESKETQKNSLSVNAPDHIPVENEASVNTHALWSPGSGLPSCNFCLRLFPSEPALHSHIGSTHLTRPRAARDSGQDETPGHSQNVSILLQSGGYITSVNGKQMSATYSVGQQSDQPLMLNTPTELGRHMRSCHSEAYTSSGQDNRGFSKVDMVQQNQCMLTGSGHFTSGGSDISCHNFVCSEHVCDLCPARFPDSQELQLHLQIAHKSTAKPQTYHRPATRIGRVRKSVRGFNTSSRRSLLANCLLCSKCNTAHSDRSSLLCHTLKVHPELNEFNVCRLCDRLFNNNIGLHRHLKKAHGLSHSGMLKCPFCPAWLPSMEMASIHRVSLHTGALPIHCPFCGAGFQSMHGMYNHVRVHHLQTETHVCPECHATFSGARALTEHARKVHGMTAQALRQSLHSSNMATYCCPFCSTALSRTYELAMHVINAHGNHLLPRRCHLCLQAFVSDPILKIHLAGAHGVDLEDGMDGVDVTEEEVDDEEMEEQEVGRRFLQQQQRQQKQNQQQKILHQNLQHGHQQNQQHCMFQQQRQQTQRQQQHHILKHQTHYHLLQHQTSALSQFEEFENSTEDQTRRSAEENEYSHQPHNFEEHTLLETQEADRFLEELQKQQTNSIGCLGETSQVLNLPMEEDTATGQLFSGCSSLVEDVQLLGSHRTNFNLCGVDYLETLTNDSIAVAADVVTAGDAAHKSQITDGPDPLELPYQFEIDGDLYQLASSMGSSGHQGEAMDTASAITEGLAHLLHQ